MDKNMFNEVEETFGSDVDPLGTEAGYHSATSRRLQGYKKNAQKIKE